MTSKMRILTKGIENKLKRGENLDDILESYNKLTEEEKNEIKDYFNK